MSGTYYVAANQDEDGHWSFTDDQIRQAAAEIRPDATVIGPIDSHGTGAWCIELPGTTRSTHEVVYQASGMFSFREEDQIDVTAGFVFRFLQRLAPEVPVVWMADFDGAVHSFRVPTLTPEEFVRELWEKA